MKQSFKVMLFLFLGILLTSNFGYSQQQKRILVFSKTAGFRHKSIEAGIESIKKLGAENSFAVKNTEDAQEFTAGLKHTDLVIFLSTTGDILNEQQQKAFEKFIQNGGAFVGIHAAADTEYEWPWFGKMVGGYFMSHPKQQQATIKVVDHKHPATEFLGKEWSRFDEWYNYKDLNPKTKVLMKLDETSYTGGENGENHPISWYHEYDGGRIFYTGLGHTNESFTDPTFLKHVLGGIQYALGQ